MFSPKQEDLLLVQQSIVNYKIKIEVYNFFDEMVNEITCGLVSGSYSIDAESDIRRTMSLVLSPDSQNDLTVSENGVIWLNRKIKLYIGIRDMVSEEYKYWANGVFVFKNTSATYDAVTNTLSVECSDYMSFWDGTRGGQLGQKTILYPAYEESIFKVVEAKPWMKILDEATFRAKVDSLTTQPVGLTNFYFDYTGTDAHDISVSDKWTVTYDVNGKTITLTNQTAKSWGIIGEGWMGMESPNFFVSYLYSGGKPISYNYIHDAIINVITQLGGIDRYKDGEKYNVKYNVDWVGEAKAQPGYEKDWDYMAYRESRIVVGENGAEYYECFTIPKDLEFSSDTTVLAILTEMRDLYENYEMFFDEEGVFYCRLKPSGDDDPIIYDSSFLESILISEESTLDFAEVKNVTEAWGKCFEPDWFTQTPATYNASTNTYSVSFDKYIDADHKNYYNGDEMAFQLKESPTTEGVKISVNGLAALDLYDENTEELFEIFDENGDPTLLPNVIYTFKIKKNRDKNASKDTIKIYFQGNWEVHAIDVLTDGTVGEPVPVRYNQADVYVNRYGEDYFKKVYNCNNVHMTVIPDSPFTVQKLGIILNVYTNEDMTSDSLGTEGARQENWRVNRLTDNITITTKLCPFADVNQKVTYRMRNEIDPKEFIVKHIDHDLMNGTTSWQLMRYYRLYVVD